MQITRKKGRERERDVKRGLMNCIPRVSWLLWGEGNKKSIEMQKCKKKLRHMLHIIIWETLSGATFFFLLNPTSKRVSGHMACNVNFEPFYKHCIVVFCSCHFRRKIAKNREREIACKKKKEKERAKFIVMHCSSQCSLKKIERRKIKSENTKQNSFITFHDFLSLLPFLSVCCCCFFIIFICTQQRQYLSEEPIRNLKMKCIARIKCIKLSQKKAYSREHRRPFYYFFS